MCHRSCSTLIQNPVLSFTDHSGQLDMKLSELPSWHPLERSEGDKVIFTVCRGSKIYDKKTTQTFLQGSSTWSLKTCRPLIGWSVETVVYVCLCVRVCMYLWFCVGVFVLVLNNKNNSALHVSPIHLKPQNLSYNFNKQFFFKSVIRGVFWKDNRKGLQNKLSKIHLHVSKWVEVALKDTKFQQKNIWMPRLF